MKPFLQLLIVLSFKRPLISCRWLLILISLSSFFSDASPLNIADVMDPVHQRDTTGPDALLAKARKVATTNPEQAIATYREMLGMHIDGITRADVLQSLGWIHFSQSHFDSASAWFHRSLQNADDLPDTLKVNGYIGLGQTYLRLARHDSTQYFLQEALGLARKASAYRLEAKIHNSFGNLYIEKNAFAQALEEYITTYKLYDSLLHDTYGQSTALFNIANIHSVMGNPEKALYYIRQGRVLALRANNTKGVVYSLKLMGRIYRKIGKADSAIYVDNEALASCLKTGDTQSACELELSLGNIYYDKGEYKTSLAHLDKALAYAHMFHGQSEMAYIHSSKGFSYYSLQQVDKAIIHFDSSRRLASAVRNAYLVMDAYEVLSSIEKDKGNFKEALALHEKWSALKDSLSRAENRKAVEEIQARYDTDRKQAQIELLQKDQRINRILTYALVAMIVFILINAGLLINRSRLRVRVASQLAEKEKELSQQQRELFEAELKTRQLEQERLKQEIEFKNKELTTYTLNLIQKNEILEELKTTLEQLDKANTPIGSVNSILQKLRFSAHLDSGWDGFRRYFEQVHTGFFDSLIAQYPELTATDLKLCALLKLNLETKEMATLLGISPESVKVSRSRLRKKLSLEAEQNLTLFLASMK